MFSALPQSNDTNVPALSPHPNASRQRRRGGWTRTSNLGSIQSPLASPRPPPSGTQAQWDSTAEPFPNALRKLPPAAHAQFAYPGRAHAQSQQPAEPDFRLDPAISPPPLSPLASTLLRRARTAPRSQSAAALGKRLEKKKREIAREPARDPRSGAGFVTEPWAGFMACTAPNKSRPCQLLNGQLRNPGGAGAASSLSTGWG